MQSVLVLPDKFRKSYADEYPVSGLLDALTTTYTTDAHFACYAYPQRLKIRDLKDARWTCAVFDMDDPEAHSKGIEASPEFRLSVWDAQQTLGEYLGEDVGAYQTRGGGRLIGPYATPIEPAQHKLFVQTVIEKLKDQGIPLDPLRDVTRLFRLPFVLRNGQPQKFETDFDDMTLLSASKIEQRSHLSAFNGIGQTYTPFTLPDTIEKGERNQTLTSYAGKLRREGKDQGEILDALIDANARCGDHPLGAEELERIAESIGSYPAPEADSDQALVRFQLGSEVEIGKVALGDIQDKLGEIIYDRGRLWHYNSGIGTWCPAPKQAVFRAVEGYDGDLIRAGSNADGTPKYRALRVSNRLTDSVLSLVKKSTYAENFFSDENVSPGLSFQDGFIGIETGDQLQPHSADNRALVAVPMTWGASSPCDLWLQTLREVWRDDPDTENKIQMLHEFMGVGLLGAATKLQRGLILVGMGANGKSTILDVLGALFRWAGTRVSAIPPQEMEKEYNRDLLCGVRLNVCSEMPETDILSGSAVKAIITGDLIVARPIREAPYMYNPRALQVFSANFLPSVTDSSQGFWRRWAALPFNREIPEGERDLNRATNIIESELPGICKLVINAGLQALTQNQYSEPDSSKDAITSWRLQADQISAWAVDRIEIIEDTGGGTTAVVLYDNYVQWCSISGHRAMSRNKFGRRLKEIGIVREHTRKGSMYQCKISCAALALA